MPTTTALPYKPHRLTVADYHRKTEAGILSEHDRVELIEGEPFDRHAIGSLHAGTVKCLSSLLKPTVGEHANGIYPRSYFFLVNFPNHNRILRYFGQADFYRSNHPSATDSLTWYPGTWIVDLDNRRLHSSREPAPGNYRSQQSLSELPTLAAVMLPGRSFDLTKLLGLTIAFITSNRTLPHTGVFQSIISFSRRLTKPCTIFPLSLTHRLNCVGT